MTDLADLQRRKADLQRRRAELLDEINRRKRDNRDTFWQEKKLSEIEKRIAEIESDIADEMRRRGIR
jgi:hypothetical protein